MHWLQRNIADTWTEAQSATIAACRVPRTQKPTEKPTSQPRAGPALGNHCRHTHRIETTPEGTTRASRTPMGHTPVPVLGTPQAAPTRAMPPHACAHLISTTNAGGLRAGRLPTAVPPHAYDKPHKPRPRSASRTLHTTKTHDTHASATTGADATPATARTHTHTTIMPSPCGEMRNDHTQARATHTRNMPTILSGSVRGYIPRATPNNSNNRPRPPPARKPPRCARHHEPRLSPGTYTPVLRSTHQERHNTAWDHRVLLHTRPEATLTTHKNIAPHVARPAAPRPTSGTQSVATPALAPCPPAAAGGPRKGGQNPGQKQGHKVCPPTVGGHVL